MYVFIAISVCEVHKVIRKNTGSMYIILLISQNFINFTILGFNRIMLNCKNTPRLKKKNKRFPEIILVISYPNKRVTLNFFPNLS